MLIYDKIKIVAKEKGVSINALEKELNFSGSTISKWNKSKPSADSLKKVADYLGVSSDYLLDKTQDPSQTLANLPITPERAAMLMQNMLEESGFVKKGGDLTEEEYNIMLSFFRNNKDILIARVKAGKE